MQTIVSWLAENAFPIVIGVLSSIASSFIYLLAVSTIRPKGMVSQHIAYSINSDGRQAYVIKFINKTRRPIINIQATLHVMRSVSVPNGIIVTTLGEVPFTRSNPILIAGFKRRDKNAEYAFRFRTFEDLATLWGSEQGTFVRFRVVASDSLSGFYRIFQHDYHDKGACIVEGQFEFGQSLKIHPLTDAQVTARSASRLSP